MALWQRGMLIITCLTIYMWQGAAQNVYISHQGTDRSNCGQSPHDACKTLAYGIGLSKQNYVIHLMASRDPYYVETPESVYVNITHSLHMQAEGGKVTISCKNNHVQLFNVFTQKDGVNATPTVKLSLQNLVFQNCTVPSKWSNTGVFVIQDAYINIQDCQFTNNAVLFYHSQLKSDCINAKLAISRSKFTANQFSKPFLPAFMIAGCDAINIVLRDSTMDWSPMKLKANENITLDITRTVFSGQNVRSSSLDVTLAPHTNTLAITDSIFKSHDYSHNSPVSISIIKPTSVQPSVHLNNVTFTGNKLTLTDGGALSLLAKMQSNRFLPMYAKITGCIFENNSCTGWGAVYIEGISHVQIANSHFSNNTAAEGGALFVTASQNITVVDSTFEGNIAKANQHDYSGKGGAVRGFASDLSFLNCTFQNNAAPYKGQSLHLTEMISVGVSGTVFFNKFPNSNSSLPRNEVDILKSLRNAPGGITFMNNTFNVSSCPSQDSLYSVTGTGIVSYEQNVLCCAKGAVSMHYTQKTPPVNDYDDAKYTMHTWCKSCPVGTYSPDVLNIQDVKCHVIEGVFSSVPELNCQDCPNYAQCPGNGVLKPVMNYWGTVKNNATSFHLCPRNFCTNQENCQTLECCSGNRAGKLCGRCRPDYHMDMVSGKCIAQDQCQRDDTFLIEYSVAFAVVYASVIIMLAVLTKISCHRSQYGDTTERREETQSAANAPAHDDSGSDSFEPSLDHTASITSHGSHGLVRVLSAELQGSILTEGDNQSIKIKPSHNAMGQSAFTFCMWVMLAQLLEVVYSPWYDLEDKRSMAITTIMDVVNLRPVFVIWDKFCANGSAASLAKEYFTLICNVSMFVVVYVIMGLLNIIVMIIAKYRRSDLSRKRTKMNAIILHALLAIFMLTYIPVLKSLFRLVHCVHNLDPTYSVLYLNANVTCHYWWHWLIVAVVIVFHAPFGIAISMGLQLLKSDNIKAWSFMAGLSVPLPAVLWWELRYNRRICRCCLPYGYIYGRMQLEEIELENSALCELHIIRFFDVLRAKSSKDSVSKSGEKSVQPHGSLSIVYLFMRAFIVVTLAILTGHLPVVKSLVLSICLLLALLIQTSHQPYNNCLANRVEQCLLAILSVLSIINIPNAVVYTIGTGAYGSALTIVEVCDWLYVAMVALFLAILIVVILIYSVKLCCSRCRHE